MGSASWLAPGGVPVQCFGLMIDVNTDGLRTTIGRMAMGKRRRDRQPTMWVSTTDLPTATSHPFYRRLNQLLREHGFDDFVEAQCAGHYAEAIGPAGSAAGHLCPAAADRVLRRHRPGARDRLARSGFVGVARFSRADAAGGASRSLDDFSDAVDRCGDPPSDLHVGAATSGGRRAGEG